MNVTGDLRGRILRGASAGALGQLLNVAGRLLLVPLFLSAWGVELYGEWLLLSSVAAWLALADLGGGIYFVNRLTSEWQLGAKERFESVLATGLVIFAVTPALFLVLLVLFTLLVPLGDWIGLSKIDSSTQMQVLILLGMHSALSIPKGLLLGVYRATGAQGTSVMLANVQFAVEVILSVVVLLAHGGLIAFGLVQLLPVALMLSWTVLDLRRRLPGLQLFNVARASSAIVRQAVSPSLHFLSIQCSQVLIVQGTTLVVGRTLGPIEVAVFSTLRTVVNLARQILGLLSHSAWPEFTRLNSTGEYQRFRGLYTVIARSTLLMAVGMVFLFEVAGKGLFELWLGDRLPFNQVALRLFSWYTVLTVGWVLVANLLMASDRHLALARVQVLTSASALAGCTLGAVFAGLPGVVVGLIVGEALPMYALSTWQASRQAWGMPVRALNREMLPVLLSVFLCVWPIPGILACGFLALRARNAVAALPT